MPKPSKHGVRGLTREPSGRWSIDLRWTDRRTGEVLRHHERLPATVSVNAAKARARDVLNSALDGLLVEQKARKGCPDHLHKALDEYLLIACKDRPKSARSRRSCVGALKAGLGDVRLEKLSPLAVERYKRNRLAGQVTIPGKDGLPANRKETVSEATVNREIAALKHFIGMASGWGWVGVEQAQGIQRVSMLVEPPGRVRHFSLEEERRLLSVLPEGMKNIVEAADLSGMRRGEVSQLLKSEVDLVARTITLTRTKSNRVRRIPINERLAALLEGALREAPESPYVFLSAHGKPYSPDSISRAFKRAALKAGVNDARFHDCRHTFATRIRSRGVGIDAIATLLGHAEITTSARYAHVEQAVLRQAVASLDDDPPLTHGSSAGEKNPSNTDTKQKLRAVS